MKTKYYTKSQEFDGFPKLSDFKIVEEDIDENLADGEILTEAMCMSVDPFIRAYPIPPGVPIIAFQVAKVLESKSEKYPKGSVVMHFSAWKTICKISDKIVWYRVDTIEPKIDFTHAVGAVGMTGLTALYGLPDICQPKEGETVMVNGCTGAVGSIVGQIAKILGCKAVGCCGSDEKVKLAKSLGYDEVFNYKTETPWKDALKRVAPNGIDCFFDNVGGQLASDIINHMNEYGRVSCCGSSSSYNSKSPTQANILQPAIIVKHLKIEGFAIFEERFRKKYSEGAKQLAKWIHEGKLSATETVTDGFENIPKAFLSMLSGDTLGKTVVRM